VSLRTADAAASHAPSPAPVTSPAAARAQPPRATLVIEASTSRASVVVTDGGTILADLSVAMGRDNDERLMPAVAAALATAQVTVADLARVICGAGPGSFTSLRIAAALAKGLVTGAGTRLGAVSSLLLIVAGTVDRLEPGQYLAALDALRGERYASLVSVEDASPSPAAARRIALHGPARRLADAAVKAWAREAGATVIGPGCAIEAWPEARGIVNVPGASIGDVDLASWEPEYGRLAEAQIRRANAERARA
jgi:tRNA threonylcarbamoyladenosine biosynthesis protein TsaB